MKFSAGVTLITSIIYNNKTYNFVARYDEDLHNLIFNLIEGDYQTPNPSILWSFGWIHIPDPRDPIQLANLIITQLNDFLKSQFVPSPIPSWEDTFHDLVFKIVLFLDNTQGNIPQAKIS